jgi:hypothetical protein
MKRYNYAYALAVISSSLQAAPEQSTSRQWKNKPISALIAVPLPNDREWCTNRWEDAFSDVWVLNGRKTSRKKYLNGIAKKVDGGRKVLEEVRDDKNDALAALLKTELEAVRQTGREKLERNIEQYVQKQFDLNRTVAKGSWFEDQTFANWERKGLDTFDSWREAFSIAKRCYKGVWLRYPAQHVVLCYKIARAQHQKKLLDTLFPAPPQMTKP